MPLVRVDYNGSNMLAGSILFLSPNAAYEVRLTLADPDGGAAAQTVTVATRPVPVMPVSGRTLSRRPGRRRRERILRESVQRHRRR